MPRASILGAYDAALVRQLEARGVYVGNWITWLERQRRERVIPRAKERRSRRLRGFQAEPPAVPLSEVRHVQTAWRLLRKHRRASIVRLLLAARGFPVDS